MTTHDAIILGWAVVGFIVGWRPIYRTLWRHWREAEAARAEWGEVFMLALEATVVAAIACWIVVPVVMVRRLIRDRDPEVWAARLRGESRQEKIERLTRRNEQLERELELDR